MASTYLSHGEQNFTRLEIICVDLIKLVLADILESQIKPADLFNKIKSCPKLQKILRPDQKKLCCCLAPDYNKLDVSLLYSLIRNLCPALKPSNDWGSTPSHLQIQIGDDIERLRQFRNEVSGHITSSNVDDKEFKSRRKHIENVLQRIQTSMILKTNPTDYVKELAKVDDKDFGFEDMEKYKTLLEAVIYVSQNAESKEHPPSISLNGADNVICGRDAIFEADVESSSTSSPWSLTWQIVRGDITKKIDISVDKYRGSTDRRLVIKKVSKEDEGEYQAVLSREVNTQSFTRRSNSKFLITTGDPPVLQTLEVSTGLEGITIHYKYDVTSDSPSVNNICWTKNGDNICIDNTKYIGGGLKETCLTIKSPTMDDAGNYTCIVTNAVDDVSESLSLGVPSATISTEEQVYFGKEIKINAVIKACPPLEEASWQMSPDSMTFRTIDTDNLQDFESNKDPNNPSLIFPKASFNNKLHYRLLIKNKIGQRFSNTVYVDVIGGPPNISNSHVTSIQRRSVTLTCEIFPLENWPPLQGVLWMKDDTEIDIAGHQDKYSGGSIDDPSLCILNVKESDKGSYQCKAINAAGSTLGDAIVLGTPDIDVQSPSNIENDAQIFTANVRSIPTPTTVQWRVKTEGTDEWTLIDVSSEDYKESTDSLPHPKLVVKRKTRIENHSFQIEVKNFIGAKTKLFPDGKTIVKTHMDDSKGIKLPPVYDHRGSTIRFDKLRRDLIRSIELNFLPSLKESLQVIAKMCDCQELQDVKSVADFLQFLIKRGIIHEGDVIILQYLLRSINRTDLNEMCVAYAEADKNRICFYQKKTEPANGYSHVPFHIAGDVKKFSQKDIDSMIYTVAAIVDQPPDSIIVDAFYNDNSFIVVLQIKTENVKKLVMKCRELQQLSTFNVDKIWIDGKEIHILQTDPTEQDMSIHSVDVRGGGERYNTASLLLDGSMENFLLLDAAQNIIKQGYLPRVVKTGIASIHKKHGPGHVITEEGILDEIINGNKPDEKLKRPNYACSFNQVIEAMPNDTKEIQRENDEMQRFLVCKRCNNTNVTHVIIKCGHLICEPCITINNICFCGSKIEKVQQVKFGNSL